MEGSAVKKKDSRRGGGGGGGGVGGACEALAPRPLVLPLASHKLGRVLLNDDQTAPKITSEPSCRVNALWIGWLLFYSKKVQSACSTPHRGEGRRSEASCTSSPRYPNTRRNINYREVKIPRVQEE
ncbi:uncharacterized [Tachysurus ichikawai]